MKTHLLQILTLLLLTACSPNNPTPHHNSTSNQGSTKEAKLKLDTKGHTDMIQDIIVTKSGDIISASVDKTIRVWDSKTGKEKRKILGQIGAGIEGKIYAIALSPNEKFLAVGGYFGESNKMLENNGDIRIYNYKTGKLFKVLKSHKGVVFDLSFSSDGKYLISGSSDKLAKIWDMQSFKLLHTIHFHKSYVNAVKIFKKNKNYFAVTAGSDKKIAIYNLQKKKIIKKYKAKYELNFIALSDTDIAICGMGKEILIFDYNLNFKKKILSTTEPKGLAYSPNNKFLITGFSYYYPNSTKTVHIYNKNQNYKKVFTFRGNNNLTQAVGFLNNHIAISAGGNRGEIYIWDWNKNNKKILNTINSVGDSVSSVGISGNTIAWGHVKINYSNEYTKLEKELNLNTLKINQSHQNFKPSRLPTTKGLLSITHKTIDDGNILLLKHNNKTIQKIDSYVKGFDYRCYGFYKNYIIAGGANGFLGIYNLKGQQIADLVGHTGEVWSIAIDGDRLISGSYDQTIKIWDLSKIKLDKKLKIDYEILKNDQKKAEKQTGKKWSIEKVKKYFDSKGLQRYYLIIPTIQPQLNLFITKTNEWIAWTPQGFYNASKGAEQYIGYHINQGAKKEAEFLDIKRFKKQFYRPDLIQKAINGEDISSYAKNIDINSLLEAGLPPKVKILNDSTNINDESIEVVVDVCDEGGSFDNLRFYVDDAPIKYLSQTKAFQHQKKAHGNCKVITQTISVPSGTHTIGFNATNKEGNIISNTPTITITNTKKAERKPNLHILTLSVADYKDDSLDLTYPNNDAKEVISKLQKIKNSVFDKVYPYSLKDSQVTYANIHKKVKEIAKKVQGEDVFILYVSGHGVTDDQSGNYYFIPYACPNSDNVDLETQAISHDKLQRIIEEVGSSKSAVFLDTCESGGMVEKQGSLDASVQRFGGNIGRAIIAGATSKQNALDGYKKHGIFTYTVLDAMDKTEHYGVDRELSINDVAEYVKFVLPRIAKKKYGHEQKPTIYLNGDTTFSIGGI